MENNLNLVFGIFLVFITLFVGTLGVLTFCVSESFEKETSECSYSEDETTVEDEQKNYKIDIDGMPVVEDDVDEDFIF